MKMDLLSAFVLTALIAAGGAAKADPAVVINPYLPGCTLLDGNGAPYFTNDAKMVATQSQNGNTLLQCRAGATPSSNGQAVHFNVGSTGIHCFVPNLTGGQFTDDWHETVSASGQATLVCQVTPN